VVGGERFGRYSFIGLPRTRCCAPTAPKSSPTARCRDARRQPARLHRRVPEALQGGAAPGLPRFCGGLAGYFGYDAVRYIEKKLADTQPPDDLGLPDIQLLLCEELAVIDNLSGKLYLIVYADPASPRPTRARAAPARTAQRCASRWSRRSRARRATETSRIRQGRLPGRRAQGQGIHRGRRHDAGAGRPAPDKPYRDNPLSLYRALRSLNPSPYMYFYNFGDFQWSAPRRKSWCARKQRGDGDRPRIVTIRPLAGTRPRGNTPERDAELATELLNDPKEIAEHVMLIDLARNDIGRIAKSARSR
jgi:anthranilate synthase component 1